MKENNYPNQIKIEDIQRKNSTAESVDFGKLSVEEAQEYIINNFVNQDKFTDTTKRLPDGREVHPNTDVQEMYVDPIRIKAEQKEKQVKRSLEAYISKDTYKLIQKRLGREIPFEEFINKFFFFAPNTEILFGIDNPAKILGGTVAYLDSSVYDTENPVNTRRYFYVANFSRLDDKVNMKNYAVITSPNVDHPMNLKFETPFFADANEASEIKGFSKSNRNTFQIKK